MNVYSMKNWGESVIFVGRKNTHDFYVNSHIYFKGEFRYENEKSKL